MHEINVYVGNFGTYEIPTEILERANALSGERTNSDKRSKGARYLKQWGKQRDAQEHALLGIPQWLDADGNVRRH